MKLWHVIIVGLWVFAAIGAKLSNAGEFPSRSPNTANMISTVTATNPLPQWLPLGVAFQVGAVGQIYLSESLDPNDANNREIKDYADLPAYSLTIYGKNTYYASGTKYEDRLAIQIISADPNELDGCRQLASQLVGRQDFYLWVRADKAYFQNPGGYAFPITTATVALKSRLPEHAPKYISCRIWTSSPYLY